MQQPFRVLHIFGILDKGGAETFIMNVYRNIDRTKVQFDFLVYDEKIGAYEEEISSLGGKIYRVPRFNIKNFFKYNKSVKEFLKKHLEYKVIHCHVSELGCVAFRQAFKIKIPHRICHAHSAPVDSGVKTLIRYFFKKAMCVYSTERMACSDIAGKWLYGKKQPFITIKNGIPVELYKYNAELRRELREQFSLEESFVIGHIGRFEPPKNHKYLINIFAEILKRKSNAHLLLVGDGSLRNDIEEEIGRLGLEQHCALLGVRDNIPDILQMMDVFVFPSTYEGLGIALIEAQASGITCFASTGVPQEANVTGLVHFISCKETPQIWADKILESNYKREDRIRDVIREGYDILGSTKFLQEYYEKCYRR